MRIMRTFDKNKPHGKESRCKEKCKKGTRFIRQGKESGKKGQESQKIISLFLDFPDHF